MASNPKPEADDTQPFFADTRSLAERVNVRERKWMPHKPEEKCPPALYGLVLELGTFTSAYGDNDTVTTARLLTADNVEWSMVAFHGWLQSEFSRKTPREGDFLAVVYQGVGEARKGESAPHLYRMVVERNPDNPLLAVAPASNTPELDEPATDERPSFESDDAVPYGELPEGF